MNKKIFRIVQIDGDVEEVNSNKDGSVLKKQAKNASKKTKKTAKKALMKNPYFWIAVVIIIVIICIIGLLGFFSFLPGMIKAKFTEFAKKAWGAVTGGDTWITPEDVSEIKEYISSMGFDLVGFGFVKDEDNAELNDNGVYPSDENDIYIKSYIKAELMSFMFEGDQKIYNSFGEALSAELFDGSIIGYISDAISSSVKENSEGWISNLIEKTVEEAVEEKTKDEIKQELEDMGIETTDEMSEAELKTKCKARIKELINYSMKTDKLESYLENSKSGMIVFPGKLSSSWDGLEVKGSVSGDAYSSVENKASAESVINKLTSGVVSLDRSVADWFKTKIDNSINYTAIIEEGTNGNLSLKIKTKESLVASSNIREYDLTEWTEQYGLPIYFLIALQIGTMAPDFSYYVATLIQPKVYFDVCEVDVTTTIEGTSIAKCNTCNWGEVTEVSGEVEGVQSTYYVWTCEKCGISKHMSSDKYNQLLNQDGKVDNSDIDDYAEIVMGTNGDFYEQNAYKTAIPYIKKIVTWYAKKYYEYSITETNHTETYEIENPEEIDSRIKTATVTDEVSKSIELKKTITIDNSGLFKALLTGDPKYIQNASVSSNETYTKINDMIFYSADCYNDYFSTADYVEKNCSGEHSFEDTSLELSMYDEDIKQAIYNNDEVYTKLGYDPADNASIIVRTCKECNAQKLKYDGKEINMPEEYAIEKQIVLDTNGTVDTAHRDAVLEVLKKVAAQGGYLKYIGTAMNEENMSYSKIETTSTMQQALEIIEETKGSGSKVIARELKKILADTIEFVSNDNYYVSTMSEAKLDTFDFLLPNYSPSIWPTDAEIGDGYTKILPKLNRNEGFEVGENVSMPAEGTLEIKGDKVILSFTEQNSYDMTMTITGITPNESLNGTKVKRGEQIGTTTNEEIVIVLLNKDGEVINVFDYMDGVYLRNDSVISAGLVYPVFYQSDSPWGTQNFYKKNKSDSTDNSNTTGINSTVDFGSVDTSGNDYSILTNKSYDEVGSGSTVMAMALSALTKKTVTPDLISLRINEVGQTLDEDESEIEESGYSHYNRRFIKSYGLDPSILEPNLDKVGDEYYYSNTNAFLSSYDVYVKKLSANAKGENLTESKTIENIMNFIRLGYPIIVYEDKKQVNETTKEEITVKQYYLLVQSSEQKIDQENETEIDNFKVYVINPTDKNASGIYTLKEFASNVKIKGAYALTTSI